LRAVGIPYVVSGFPGFVAFAIPWLKLKDHSRKCGREMEVTIRKCSSNDMNSLSRIAATKDRTTYDIGNLRTEEDNSSTIAREHPGRSMGEYGDEDNQDEQECRSNEFGAGAGVGTVRQSSRLSMLAASDEAFQKVPSDLLYELDVERMIDQIGNAIVPVITSEYEGTGPIKNSMTVET
jgi:hypothetical protein